MISRLLRCIVALPLVAVGLGAASGAAGVGPAAPLCAQAAATHRAGVVVEHGDGRALRRCVGFSTATATALAVLQGSGLEVGTSSYGGGLGTAICQIDYEPATYPPGCFTATGSYWVLFVSRGGGAWSVSDLGASNVSVANGDDIGFRFDSQNGADPPPSPAWTCPVVTPPPARTPAPTARATARPRATTSAPASPTTHPATAPPAATPTAGVLGVATPGATPISVGSLRSAGPPPGVNVGVLLAVVGAGGLVGLLFARALRRRRE